MVSEKYQLNMKFDQKPIKSIRAGTAFNDLRLCKTNGCKSKALILWVTLSIMMSGTDSQTTPTVL